MKPWTQQDETQWVELSTRRHAAVKEREDALRKAVEHLLRGWPFANHRDTIEHLVATMPEYAGLLRDALAPYDDGTRPAEPTRVCTCHEANPADCRVHGSVTL